MLDGVAVVVVVVAVAVIALQPVAADGLLGCRVEEVVGGVEGEGLCARPGDAAQRVVFEPGRAAALVAAFGQVAVAVVVADGLVTLLKPSERFFRRPFETVEIRNRVHAFGHTPTYRLRLTYGVLGLDLTYTCSIYLYDNFGSGNPKSRTS